MNNPPSPNGGSKAGEKRKASVTDAIEDLHISPPRARKIAKRVKDDDGLLILEGDDLVEDEKPNLKKVNIPFEGPISLRMYAQLIEEQAAAEAADEADEMDVDMDVDMDEVEDEIEGERGNPDITMTDADDLWQPVTDQSAHQAQSTAQEGGM